MYPTIFPAIEIDEQWIAIALAWIRHVDVPVPNGLRIISQPDYKIFLLSHN